MSFVGRSLVSIDQKRRMAIPARYREELAQSCANKLVCTVGHRPEFLRLFPRPLWNELEARIETDLLWAAEDDDRARYMTSSAEDVFVDGNHRMLLPQHLVERASLEKKVMLVGRSNHFEIWSEENWQLEDEANRRKFSAGASRD